MTKQKAILELLFAASLWGFGFVATTWSLQSFSPAETLFWRFLVAFAAGEIIRIAIQKKTHWPIAKKDWTLFLGAGIFLGLMLLFQTIGLKYTTATKSGFITSLYIVIIPLLTSFLKRSALPWRLWLNIGIAFLGMFMLLGNPFHDWNQGDFWTFLCALMAAGHIMYIGSAAKKNSLNSLQFNNYQSLIALLVLIPLVSDINLTTKASPLAWVGIVFLGLGSSFLAFAIQVRAQKHLSDTTASMLFLLESPFAFLFAYLILGETLSYWQIFGAFFILFASYRASKIELN